MTIARIAGAVLALGIVTAAYAGRRGQEGRYDDYRLLRGSLQSIESRARGSRGRYAVYSVRLLSSSGLLVTGRMLQPPGAGPFPAVLLNDGRELNSAALDALPQEFGDVVVLSLDYPESLPYEIRLSSFVLRGGSMRKAARLIPASFSLGAEYLSRKEDVDSARVAIVATSFAVPFATIAAAMDARFHNVGLIYGAGDFAEVLAANLTIRPKRLRSAAAWLATRAFREFEPARHIGGIHPRPVIMVNGIDDPQMPKNAVEELYDAAREPKEIIWLRTGHLMPTDTALIRLLVDTAFARLPVLRFRPRIASHRALDAAGTALAGLGTRDSALAANARSRVPSPDLSRCPPQSSPVMSSYRQGRDNCAVSSAFRAARAASCFLPTEAEAGV